MKYLTINTGIIVCALLIQSCNDDNGLIGSGGTSPNTNSGGWLIPENEVRDGGPGKDGIPALTNPDFKALSKTDYVSDNDLILGFKSGVNVKAYPHDILDWHEIINDEIGNIKIAVTYCPLTGTGIGWDREINGTVTTFGVSGLLYNSNLIPYDRESNSNWSQMRLDCVNGSLKGTKAKNYTLVETTWGTWKEMYPESSVLSTSTGYSRSYGRYPYGSYRTNNSYIIFPVSNTDSRIENKERVHGIIDDGKVKTYRFNLFSDSTTVITDTFNDNEIVVAGSEEINIIVSFLRKTGDGTLLEFHPVQNQLPVILEDNEGSKWDVFGMAVEGPREGEQLTPTISMIGYWFAWAAFYPDLTIYAE